MAYGIKYYGEFDSFKDDACMYFVVQILEKDFTGDPTAILLSGVPAVQEWQDDERNKPIKGSTLKVGIINNGIVSLESFYSDYDDQYMVTLRQRSTDAVLFTGFIIQDECSEILTDFAHEINITATDMLGTLKDITLGQAAEQYGDLTTFSAVSLNALDSISLVTTDTRVAGLKPGQKVSIDNGSFAGQYTVTNLTWDSIFHYRIYFSPANFTPFTSDTCDMTWRVPTDLSTYMPLGKIVRLCLQSTKLELNTKVIATLYDVDGDTMRWLDSTCVMATTFLNNGQWMSCYEVLENILQRFRATLLQSKGFWWIIRYNELFIGNIAPSPGSYLYGYQYDYEMDYQSDINTNSTFLSFNYNSMEFGTTKSIERPIGYTKDTFQYVQPDSLLKNPNLTELGNLIEVTTYGSGTSLEYYYEYELPYWTPWDDHPTPSPDARIRVVKDYLQVEKERYIVLTGDGTGSIYSSAFALQSNDIELSKNDIINFSFDFRTDISSAGPISLYFEIRSKDGINPNIYINSNGFFQSTPGYGWYYNVPTGDNTIDWHSVTIKSQSLPNDCIINLFLAICTPTASDKTYYKNLNLEIQQVINNNGNVNGQTHTYNNLIDLNNIIETDIKLDTTSSASIAGTLFLDNYTGILRNKSLNWAYPGGIYGGYMALGKRVLMEELFIKYKARYKYEGNLLNVYVPFPGDYIIGPETVFIYNNDLTDPIRFIFGKLSIDYKQGMADCTMLYISNKDEDIGDINDGYVYEFNYLYENN